MPLTVEVPTRLRIDADALAQPGGEELIADGLTAAATRALAASARVALTASRRPILTEPTFTWGGDGLRRLGAAQREAVEATITGALARAAAASEAAVPARSGRPAPAERLDPARHAPLHGSYVVPSYDGRGRPQRVEIDFDPQPVVAGAGGFSEVLGVPGSAWTEHDWLYAFQLACEERNQGVPSHNAAGLFYARAAGGYGIRLFEVYDLATGDIVVTEQQLVIGDLWGWELDERGRPVRLPASISGLGDLRLRAVGDTSTPSARLAIRVQRAREQLARVIDAERVRLIAALRDADATFGDADFDAWRQQRLEQVASGLTDDASAAGLIELLVDDKVFLITLAESVTWPAGTLVPLVPYTVFERRSVPGAGGRADGRGGRRAGGRGRTQEHRGGDRRGGDRGGGEGDLPGGRHGGTGDADDGGFVAVPGQEGAHGGALFPTTPDGETRACVPFLEEPPLSALGADGEHLRRLIERIAGKLAIEPCEFAGGFAVSAASAFGGRAGDVGRFSVTASDAFVVPPAGDGAGNLGTVDFRPAPSPAIAFMRHLAAVAPDIDELVAAIDVVYRKPEHHGKIGSFDRPISWVWRFLAEVNDEMRWSVAVMFGMTCRVLLLQLLRSSASQLQGRLSQIGAYAELFEEALLPRLRHIDELRQLRDLLREAGTEEPVPQRPEALPGGVAEAPATADDARAAWNAARTDLTGALAGPDRAPPADGQATRLRGEIVRPAGGGLPRIHDGRGRAWSLNELEQGIVARRGWIETLDPLVKQMVELPEVLQRFEQPGRGVRGELESLLREMLANNAEQTREVTDSWMYAVRASRINESIPTATVSGTSFALGGIHMQAHTAIGDAFRGCGYYGMGIDALFSSELGRAGLISFFEFTGTLFLAIVCPPLGAAVGIALAGYHLEEAHEREQLYESLIDPELVLTRAEVEADLFVARLGFVLAIVPEAGTILRGGARVGASVARSGVSVAARGAGRGIARHLTEEAVRSLRRGIVIAFLREIATDRAVDLVAQQVLGPIVAQIERESSVSGPAGGRSGASATLARLAVEALAAETEGAR